jgi:hypothetical protein
MANTTVADATAPQMLIDATRAMALILDPSLISLRLQLALPLGKNWMIGENLRYPKMDLYYHLKHHLKHRAPAINHDM